MLRDKNKYFTKAPETWVEVPSDYKASAKWSPRIGEFFPNFSGQSTMGQITFHPYITGSWTIFFSIADPFSEICTKELARMTLVQDGLRRAGIRTVGISRNSVAELERWCELVSNRSGKPVSFPVISDPDGLLTDTFGMIHPHADPDTTIRKTMIINPQLKVSMIFEYPLYIPRSTKELLRALEAARSYFRDVEAK